MNYVQGISPGNKSLKFIDFRLLDDKYRGSISSQHNRYTMEQIIKILSIFNSFVPNKKMMQIRTSDIVKRPMNIKEEAQYALFCDEAKRITGIGTQDAMRKNLFVDLHRMGLINRFNKNKKEIDPFGKGREKVKYVSLTDQGIKLITTTKLVDKYFIFSKSIDNLLGGHINILLNILRDECADLGFINFYEFMFFVSAINTNTSFEITIEECIDYIKGYRLLSPIQKRSVVETLKSSLVPQNYSGNKKKLRDFHNWKNKIDQIFLILKQTIYFRIDDDRIVLSQATPSAPGEFVPMQFDRSSDVKKEYFTQHNINKINGFELHHVVPLSWSESMEQFKLLDNWMNLVYIDGGSHAKITQNRNRNVRMAADNNSIILKDFGEHEVCLKYPDNILYDVSKQGVMVNYNKSLLET